MSAQTRGTGAQLVGLERSSAPGHAVVLDGFGNEIPVFKGERKAFPVRLEMDSFLLWRSMEGFGLGGVPVTQRTRPLRPQTNFVEVSNEEAAVITFSCYADPSLAPSLPPPPPAQTLGGTGGAPYQVPVRALHVPDLASGDVSTPFSEVHAFLQHEPNLRKACMAGGALMALYNLTVVLNVFTLIEDQTYYVVSCYLLFFGLVTCVTELHPSVADFGPLSWVQRTQDWLHEWAEGLTTLWGRGLFYIFQGSLVAASSSVFSAGFLISAYMFGLGVYCLSQSGKSSEFDTQEDYIRVSASEPLGRMGLSAPARPVYYVSTG